MEPTNPDVTEESAACTEILEVPGRRPVTTDYNAEEEENNASIGLVWKRFHHPLQFHRRGHFQRCCLQPYPSSASSIFFYICICINIYIKQKYFFFPLDLNGQYFFGHLQRQ